MTPEPIAPRPWPKRAASPGQVSGDRAGPDARNRPPAFDADEVETPTDPPAPAPFSLPPPSPVVPPVVPQRRGATRPVTLAVAGVVALVILLVVLLSVLGGERTGGGPVIVGSGAPLEPTASSSGGGRVPSGGAGPEPSTRDGDDDMDPDAQAVATLQQLRQDDRSRLSPDGRWVVQLSSKYPGIRTPRQVSPSGDRKYSADEILQEHQDLRDRFGDDVLLALSTDYGLRQKVDGHALWVTFADPGISSKGDGEQWCSDHFPDLAGSALDDKCAVRNLNPPH